MMRKLFIATTATFWAMVFAFWGGSLWSPDAEPPLAAAPDRAIAAAELAKHATPETCWMAIRGDVYDLAAYLPDHPSRPQIIEPWCGKDATEAYTTKTKNRPHSKEADALLPKYRIGRLSPER
ncbi:cytochrome b involved in lipid metabolism [Rhodopseudomonas rhenobacensis]|uniref:Cytochrome b involved in lipid metabolism n=1 Tax=Rhodopseudomonas rhenobacensis TaxID=87461 RepID=A0A7W7Z2U7_9BRAD|nr:cytochrome b5-like heme/steroid binding domain-containing protein [Rhodopseudomonas rhenobacensis]MBB5046632.1 cytochrome b involved in lipid metabolism [Rhodopseudomonas rhenobacensis]